MKLFYSFLLTCSVLIANPFDFDTINSEFKQTITNDENSKIVYKGSFYATSKAQALWIYKTPIDKKIYFNQNRVTIIEPELEQAIITNLENTPNLTEILKSAKNISKDKYTATYDSVKYKITTENDKIKNISYLDKLENSVVIELFNQSNNTFLDEILFDAIIPNGFDVVLQ